MGALKISAGDLRTLIDIYVETTTGTGGFKAPTHAKSFSCWSQWVNAHGTDAIVADANQVQKIATVTVRYNSLIKENCKVYLGTDAYDIITGIDDVGNRHEWMQFKVRAVVAG